MAIVKQKNQKTGVTYVYESFSYRDEITKQPRAKRKLLGRLDEETGEIIPTRKKKVITTDAQNETDSDVSDKIRSLEDKISKQYEEIRSLKSEISKLKNERKSVMETLAKVITKLNS